MGLSEDREDRNGAAARRSGRPSTPREIVFSSDPFADSSLSSPGSRGCNVLVSRLLSLNVLSKPQLMDTATAPSL